MAVVKRGKYYWYEFIFAGKRIRESAKTTSKTVAKEAEKDRRRALERTLAGLPAENRADPAAPVPVDTSWVPDAPVRLRRGDRNLADSRLADRNHANRRQDETR